MVFINRFAKEPGKVVWQQGSMCEVFARQRWRAWIETKQSPIYTSRSQSSPVSDGGRGLKPVGQSMASIPRQFARQRWRAWIETCQCPAARVCRAFARQRWRAWIETAVAVEVGSKATFARQRWRAWIETRSEHIRVPPQPGSPVSDGGRGLKPFAGKSRCIRSQVRPSAMAGVD